MNRIRELANSETHLKSVGLTHRQILLKFAALTGEILEGTASIKGQRGEGGLPSDELVQVRHRLHDLVRGIYKPRGWVLALSILLTESAANYGRELRYRSYADWTCRYHAPSRKRDARAAGDTNALRENAGEGVPVGVIRILSPSRYEVLGLGKIRLVTRSVFQIRPYTISPAEQQDAEERLSREISRKVEAGDYSLPDKPGVTKVRVAQRMFRRMMQINYGDSCAFCGFPEGSMLVAGHIARYADDRANRLNPHNGILLCRLCDGAFELGMIDINPDMTLHISSILSGSLESHPVGQAWLQAVRSGRVEAKRWVPDSGFLEAHRGRYTVAGDAYKQF